MQNISLHPNQPNVNIITTSEFDSKEELKRLEAEIAYLQHNKYQRPRHIPRDDTLVIEDPRIMDLIEKKDRMLLQLYSELDGFDERIKTYELGIQDLQHEKRQLLAELKQAKNTL